MRTLAEHAESMSRETLAALTAMQLDLRAYVLEGGYLDVQRFERDRHERYADVLARLERGEELEAFYGELLPRLRGEELW